jgi:hypothetical protein
MRRAASPSPRWQAMSSRSTGDANASRATSVSVRPNFAAALVDARGIRGEDGREEIGAVEVRRGAGVGDRAAGEQPFGRGAADDVQRVESAGPPVAAPGGVGAALEQHVDDVRVLVGCVDERGGVEGEHRLVQRGAQLGALAEERAQRRRVAALHGSHEALARRQPIVGEPVDVFLQLAPAPEAVLAREDELRVGEGELRLVRQLGAESRGRVRVAGAVGAPELLGELLLLREVGACGKGAAGGGRHVGLLR